MADAHEHEMEADDAALRQRLLRRIGIAGVLIVVLIASLSIFDAVFVAPPEEAAAPQADSAPQVPVEPAPAAAPTGETPASEPATSETTAPETAPAETPAPATAPTDADATPNANPNANAAAPAPDAKEVRKPISRPDLKAAARHVEAAPEGSAAPTVPQPQQPPPAVEKPLPAERALTRPLQARQPTAATRPLAPGQGYQVQMGVFSNLDNAQDLKRRLDQAGIPAHIEARVQVGPFRSKAEAEAAQKKLAQMGLSGLLLSPRK